MHLRDAYRSIIEPALLLLPAKMESLHAIVMLLVIDRPAGIQVRSAPTVDHQDRQWCADPGTERPGNQLLADGAGRRCAWGANNEKTARLTAAICAKRNVKATDRVVWEAIEHDDILAAWLACLLL